MSQASAQSTFCVIFRGDLVPGFTVADVKASFARLFKAGPETVEKLFVGRPVTLKKGLTRTQAEQYQAALAKIGAQVSIRAEAGPEAQAPAAPAPRVEEGSQPRQQPDWSLAPMEGDLLKDHEREQKASVQVSVDHLSLVPAEGNLVKENERRPQKTTAVDIPEWQLQ